MPKYEYPAHIYSSSAQHTLEDRKQEELGADTSSSSSEEEAEFFSNQEFLKSRAHAVLKGAGSPLSGQKLVLSQFKAGVGQLREGRAYIEGGSHY